MITLKLDKKGNGKVYLSRNRMFRIHGQTFLCEFKYGWSWRKLRFAWWLTDTGMYDKWTELKRDVKKHYNIIVDKSTINNK